MRLKIQDYCCRCGICEDLHGELFHFDLDADEIKVKYDIIPSELEEEARAAISDCSLAAIHIVRE